jgi:hypothetical protein
VYGTQRAASARAQASRWRDRADHARQALTEIESLPVAEAAQLLRERDLRQKAQESAERQAQQQEQKEAAAHRTRSPVQRPTSPGLGR